MFINATPLHFAWFSLHALSYNAFQCNGNFPKLQLHELLRLHKSTRACVAGDQFSRSAGREASGVSSSSTVQSNAMHPNLRQSLQLQCNAIAIAMHNPWQCTLGKFKQAELSSSGGESLFVRITVNLLIINPRLTPCWFFQVEIMSWNNWRTLGPNMDWIKKVLL